MSVKEKVIYIFYNEGAKSIEKEADICFDRLNKNVLLNLYYADMMKLKEKAYDVLNLIGSNLSHWCLSP